MKQNPFAILKKEQSGGGFAFDADNNKVMTLNPSAVRLWELFAAGIELHEAVRILAAEFEGADEEQILRDAESFRSELLRRNLFFAE